MATVTGDLPTKNTRIFTRTHVNTFFLVITQLAEKVIYALYVVLSEAGGWMKWNKYWQKKKSKRKEGQEGRRKETEQKIP